MERPFDYPGRHMGDEPVIHMTLADAASWADLLEPGEEIVVNGDNRTVELWSPWEDGARSLKMVQAWEG